mmetsp:Transcript_2483/g.2870  ORF Transcript_2483/g.2870 Transcript_2483/m.2870 type:complete len:122 (+) Transcript_2483:401-766(+)
MGSGNVRHLAHAANPGKIRILHVRSARSATKTTVPLVPLARHAKETNRHVPLRLLCAGVEAAPYHLRRPLDAPDKPGVEPMTRLQQVVHKGVRVVRDSGKGPVPAGGKDSNWRRCSHARHA